MTGSSLRKVGSWVSCWSPWPWQRDQEAKWVANHRVFRGANLAQNCPEGLTKGHNNFVSLWIFCSLIRNGDMNPVETLLNNGGIVSVTDVFFLQFLQRGSCRPVADTNRGAKAHKAIQTLGDGSKHQLLPYLEGIGNIYKIKVDIHSPALGTIVLTQNHSIFSWLLRAVFTRSFSEAMVVQ